VIAVRGSVRSPVRRGRRPSARTRAVSAWHRWAWLRVAAAVVVALVAAGAATATAGGVSASVGPVDARLVLVPSLTGGTQVQVPPLGELELDTHRGPLRLRAEVDGLRLDDARALVARGTTAASVGEELTADVRSAVVRLVVRSALVALAAGALACLVVFRRRGAVAAGTAGVAVALLATGGLAAATADSRALAEPRYTGLLSRAPALVGDLASVGSRFDVYQTRVAALTGSVSRLYSALSGLPDAATTGDDDVRVLWVSDVHNNPEAYRLMSTLATEFGVSAVVDTGDSTDFGSDAEARLLTPMAGFGVPYLWVRGNHDSTATQTAVADLGGDVVVLDGGDTYEVAGIRFAGTGDPRFNPSSFVVNDSAREELTAAGERLAGALDASAAAGEPVDVALVHEPPMALPLVGRVPLVLDGHTHQRASAVDGDTLLLTQGSSGGAGLRTLVGDEPLPLQMSVLHFDPDDGSLLAVDDVTVGGVGQDSATVERRTAASYREESAAPDDVPPLEEPSDQLTGQPSLDPSAAPSPAPTELPPLLPATATAAPTPS